MPKVDLLPFAMAGQYCHMTQTSKESALKINITSLTDVNKNTSADYKLLCQSDCYTVLL